MATSVEKWTLSYVDRELETPQTRSSHSLNHGRGAQRSNSLAPFLQERLSVTPPSRAVTWREPPLDPQNQTLQPVDGSSHSSGTFGVLPRASAFGTAGSVHYVLVMADLDFSLQDLRSRLLEDAAVHAI